MTSDIPFKRTVRLHNGCYYISIPLALINAKGIKPGYKLECTINLISDPKEKSEAVPSDTALIKTPQIA